MDGICFTTKFFGPDGAEDWAFAFAKGRVMVVVYTQRTDTSRNALYLAQAIAAQILSRPGRGRMDRPPAVPAAGVIALSATQIATLHTSAGDIRIELFGNHAPKTVKNFVDLATGGVEWTHPGTGTKTNDPLYDGTIFHRVIAGFMIQGGDPLGQGFGGPGYKFADEFHPELSFDRPYLLAMANSGPNTNGSQFFITVGRTPHLNRKHSIFGEVADAESRAVVDAIATTQVGRGDKPVQDITINSVTVEPAS